MNATFTMFLSFVKEIDFRSNLQTADPSNYIPHFWLLLIQYALKKGRRKNSSPFLPTLSYFMALVIHCYLQSKILCGRLHKLTIPKFLISRTLKSVNLGSSYLCL